MSVSVDLNDRRLVVGNVDPGLRGTLQKAVASQLQSQFGVLNIDVSARGFFGNKRYELVAKVGHVRGELRTQLVSFSDRIPDLFLEQTGDDNVED